MTLEELEKLGPGTVLVKGNKRRVIEEISSPFILFHYKSQPKRRIGEKIYLFEKWMKGARVDDRANGAS